jgi:hypothetical protein
MRKLRLSKEYFTELATDDLARISAGLTVGDFAIAIQGRTVKDTECGNQCLNTYPLNQCYLSILC